ncbi:MAG TPA: response regulator transcription factor [Miltoncostaeaceae bacterium]|nr:response regulator transcription factor [Miltoncostaeaceae bacterium]
MPPRILVVEDDRRVASSLERALRAHGHEVEVAHDGATALRCVRSVPDALVLDVNLPDVSGLEVCRMIRVGGLEVPVLMLTARASVEDRVAGLDAGADDYLVKPFALAELLARVRALLRRSLGGDGAGADLVQWEDLVLDLRACTGRRGARPLELTRTELRLLELFMRNPGRVLTREQMLDRVWGVDARTSSNGVEVYVGYLRRKLEAGGEPRVLQTVRGLGYVLRA